MPHPRWTSKDEFPGSISLPFGIKTSHTWHEVGQILRIINDLDVQTFVEIGAHVGGLGSIVSCVQKYRPFKYVGIEINGEIIDDLMRGKIFINDALQLSTARYIREQAYEKTFFYCDGGNKIYEMNLYGNYLRDGDIIACHDWFNGQEVYGLNGFGVDNGECGCRPEVSYSDLLDFFQDPRYKVLDDYLLRGTRIMGLIYED